MNRQIEAVRILEILTPTGVKFDHESVARSFSGLKDEQMLIAAKEATRIAGDKPLTARIVKQASLALRGAPPVRTPVIAEPLSPRVHESQSLAIDFGPARQALKVAEALAGSIKSDALVERVAELQNLLIELEQSHSTN